MLPTRVLRNRNVWDSPLSVLRDELDRAFHGQWPETGDVFASYPVDIREDEDHIYIEAEVPGFKKSEIDITLENGVLTISAERKVEPVKGESHLNERRFTRVQRRFTMPNTVDESRVDAKLEDGVLHLTLNKREEVKPRKIEVK